VNDVSAQDIPGNGLGDATVFAWLQLDIGTYNSNLNGHLPAPTTSLTSFDNLSPDLPSRSLLATTWFCIMGRVLAVRDKVVAWWRFTSMLPDLCGSGQWQRPERQRGHFVCRLWDHGTQVPDGGTSLVLLGMALSALGLVYRRVRS
jgi:hypothetical protein